MCVHSVFRERSHSGRQVAAAGWSDFELRFFLQLAVLFCVFEVQALGQFHGLLERQNVFMADDVARSDKARETLGFQ